VNVQSAGMVEQISDSGRGHATNYKTRHKPFGSFAFGILNLFAMDVNLSMEYD
jgi:hypothetical protein